MLKFESVNFQHLYKPVSPKLSSTAMGDWSVLPVLGFKPAVLAAAMG